MIDVKELYRRLTEISRRRRYPGPEDLTASLSRCLKSLNRENPSIRPPDREGRPGGLVQLKPLPTVIVPDLHARVDYMAALAEWIPPDKGLPLLESLSRDEIQVVCVGDGFHAERRALERWKEALEEFTGGFRKHGAMDEEMKESLGVMQIVMEWKAAFPDNFHFLKGNHENIANENSPENRAFRKFAFEGEMVAVWFKEFLGMDLFTRYYQFEKGLPVFAVGPGFCIIHAEPKVYHNREEIINCTINREIIYDFTWTDDGAAAEDSVKRYLDEYFPDLPQAVMFGGHRPVRGNYNLRAGGKYIQIHNPEKYIAAYINGIRDFSINKNIFVLEK